MKLTLNIPLIGGYLFAAGNHRLVFLNVKVTAYILRELYERPSPQPSPTSYANYDGQLGITCLIYAGGFVSIYCDKDEAMGVNIKVKVRVSQRD